MFDADNFLKYGMTLVLDVQRRHSVHISFCNVLCHWLHVYIMSPSMLPIYIMYRNDWGPGDHCKVSSMAHLALLIVMAHWHYSSSKSKAKPS